MNANLSPKAKCPKCGHERLMVSQPRTDASRVACERCKADLGAFGKFRDNFVRQAVAPSIANFKQRLKDIGRKLR